MSAAAARDQPPQHHHYHAFPSPSHTHTRPAPRKNMSITQTYRLAHKARAKLSREAARPDHDLRLLVGHANLLDSLMLELADAEREQERWFNQSVRGASKTPDRRVQWADSIVDQQQQQQQQQQQPDEEYDSASSDSSSDSQSDSDPEEYGDEHVHPGSIVSAVRTSAAAPVSVAQQLPSQRVVVVTEREAVMGSDDDVDDDDDLQEDYAQLELVRTPSHSNSPPELLVDHDSESSDDESLPPSPTDASLEYSRRGAKEQTEEIFEAGYYGSRQASQGLVSAISVY
ncbi:hypothetical protein E4U41_000854 [Claviceps citrina]|nr:hypothetical protein E4U41_000854 [Claviceps citrina]